MRGGVVAGVTLKCGGAEGRRDEGAKGRRDEGTKMGDLQGVGFLV